MNPGIPPDLSCQLRDKLPHCGPFGSDEELRAVFVDARLKPWQQDLRKTNNISNRVDAVVSFLYERKDFAGVNALVLLLRVLRDRVDPGDDCYQSLGQLADELEKSIASHPQKQKLVFIPFEEGHLIGRERLLSILMERLETNVKKSSFQKNTPICITGLRGIGKTHLVAEYGFRNTSYYDKGVFWIDSSMSHSTDSWEKQICDFADALWPHLTSEPAGRKISEFLSYLDNSGSRALVIFDNLPDERLLHNKLQMRRNFIELDCHILYTTPAMVGKDTHTTVEIEELSPEHSVQLLGRTAERSIQPDSEEEEWTQNICQELDYLPLAIEIAGTYLRIKRSETFKGYYQRIEGKSLTEITTTSIDQHFSKGWRGLHKPSIREAFELQFNEVGPDSRRILALISLISDTDTTPLAQVVSFADLATYPISLLIDELIDVLYYVGRTILAYKSCEHIL